MRSRLGPEAGLGYDESCLGLTRGTRKLVLDKPNCYFPKVGKMRRLMKRADQSKLKKLNDLRVRLQALSLPQDQSTPQMR